MFVFQLEWEILFGEHNKADSFMHPAVLFPFLGELFFIFALFQSKRWPTVVGIILCGLLVLMFLLIGILEKDIRVLLSTLPFIGLSVFYFMNTKKQKNRSL